MKFQKSYNERNGAQRGKEKEIKENNYLAKKGEKIRKDEAWNEEELLVVLQRTNVDPVTRSFFNDPVTSSSISQAQDIVLRLVVVAAICLTY